MASTTCRRPVGISFPSVSTNRETDSDPSWRGSTTSRIPFAGLSRSKNSKTFATSLSLCPYHCMYYRHIFAYGYLFIPQIAIAIGVLTSNRGGRATNHFCALDVAPECHCRVQWTWCHCWVPLLGAIAGCHCRVPL